MEREDVVAEQVDEGLHLIDLNFQGQPGIIGAYLLEDNGERALIETGPSSTLPGLLAGLKELHVPPESITKLLVTHIHLDHAGAAGTFLRRFPNAHLYLHEAGAPHLQNPEKLLRSAARIYGDKMDTLWGEVLPVPEDRMTPVTDNDVITVGQRRLRVLYTPGHASHHVAFYDEERNGIFTGDVAAVRLSPYSYVRPPTPPPDIDLELWRQSLDRLRALNPAALYLTHYGRFDDVTAHLDRTEQQLQRWGETVERGLGQGLDDATIVQALGQQAADELRRVTSDPDALARYELATPMDMTVSGYRRYFQKRPR